MSVRIEKSGSVWTVINSRPEARNAVDSKGADALVAAFEQFEADSNANSNGNVGGHERTCPDLAAGLGQPVTDRAVGRAPRLP